MQYDTNLTLQSLNEIRIFMLWVIVANRKKTALEF